MTESASVTLADQDLMGDGLTHRRADLRDWPPGGRRQQPIINGAADEGGHAQHGLDELRQPSDTGEDRVPDRCRKGTPTCGTASSSSA